MSGRTLLMSRRWSTCNRNYTEPRFVLCHPQMVCVTSNRDNLKPLERIHYWYHHCDSTTVSEAEVMCDAQISTCCGYLITSGSCRLEFKVNSFSGVCDMFKKNSWQKVLKPIEPISHEFSVEVDLNIDKHCTGKRGQTLFFITSSSVEAIWLVPIISA